MESSTTAYVLDKRNYIVSVSGPWDQFASEKDGMNVNVRDVCGRSIWDFIIGDTTRMWLEAIFQLARVRNDSIVRSYRCDSPKLKRFMRMHIVPCEDGTLHIKHKVLGIEERPIPVYIRYSSSTDKGNIRIRCSLCGRVNNGKAWEEPSPGHADASSEIIVAYSVCEDCCLSLPGQIKTKPRKANATDEKSHVVD